MSTKLRLAVWLANACILFSTLSLTASPQQDEPKRLDDAEEYAVYSAVLKTKYSDEGLKRFVIATDTSSYAKTTFIGIRTGLAPSGAKRPDMDPETSADFDAKNKETYQLADRLSLTIPYALVTEDQLRKIFHETADGKLDEECWHRFYKEFPGAPGVIAFSRVGFNAKKDQALLYVGNQRDFLGGSGVFYLLSKRDKAWQVDKGVILWLS
jgi:hypothetical protein